MMSVQSNNELNLTCEESRERLKCVTFNCEGKSRKELDGYCTECSPYYKRLRSWSRSYIEAVLQSVLPDYEVCQACDDDCVLDLCITRSDGKIIGVSIAFEAWSGLPEYAYEGWCSHKVNGSETFNEKCSETGICDLIVQINLGSYCDSKENISISHCFVEKRGKFVSNPRGRLEMRLAAIVRAVSTCIPQNHNCQVNTTEEEHGLISECPNLKQRFIRVLMRDIV